MPTRLDGLRVLAFSDWYTPAASGGAERAAWEVYRRLGQAGVAVRVVSFAHGLPHQDTGVEVREIGGIDLTRLAGAYLAPAPSAFAAVRAEMRTFRPDVLHASTLHYTGCLAAARTADRTAVPLVTTMQLGPLDHLPAVTRWLGARYDATVGRYILRRSARVLAVSEAVRRHAVALGADPAAVDLAPNGVEHERFRMPPMEPADEPLVISVGRLLANKGPQLLVEAAVRLRAEGRRFRLAFVGDGPLRAQLETRVAETGLREVVSFPGHVAQPERWYRKADIVVRPSFTEGLPLAVIEAMAAGRCNIVSDIAANLELIDGASNGLTFRCGDAGDLARALAVALADPARRVAFGRQAARDSLQYSWERMAAVTGGALLSVASRAPGDGASRGPSPDRHRRRHET